MTDERESPGGDDNWDDLADFLGAEGAKDQFSGNDEDDDPELAENDGLESDAKSHDSHDDAVEEDIDEAGDDVSEDADWEDGDQADDADEPEEEAGDWIVLAEQLGIETGELEDELESVDDKVVDMDQVVDESLEEDADETDAADLPEEEPEDGPEDTEEIDEDAKRLTAGEGEALDKDPVSEMDEAVAEIARLFGSDEKEESKAGEGDDSGDDDPELEGQSAKPRGRRRRSRRGRRPDAVKTDNGDQGNGESSEEPSEEAGSEDKKGRRGRRGGRRRGDKATSDRVPAEQGAESGNADEAVARKAARKITTWKDVVGVIVDGNIAADRKDQKPRRKRRSK